VQRGPTVRALDLFLLGREGGAGGLELSEAAAAGGDGAVHALDVLLGLAHALGFLLGGRGGRGEAVEGGEVQRVGLRERGERMGRRRRRKERWGGGASARMTRALAGR
jgi:hypothetical protein